MHVLDLSNPWNQLGHGLETVVLAGVAGQHMYPSNVPLHHSCDTPGTNRHRDTRQSAGFDPRPQGNSILDPRLHFTSTLFTTLTLSPVDGGM